MRCCMLALAVATAVRAAPTDPKAAAAAMIKKMVSPRARAQIFLRAPPAERARPLRRSHHGVSADA